MSAVAWLSGEEEEGEEEDSEPVIKAGVYITLKVQDTNGRTVYHTMRSTDDLQSLMDFYYATVPAVAHGTGRFLYDGRRLSGWQTPAELEMEDGDEVYFFTELRGTLSPSLQYLLPGLLRHSLSIYEQNKAPAREEETLKAVDETLFVTLKVVDQRQNLIRHTMRTTDKLQVVMDAYYDKVPGVQRGTGTFWFEAVCLHRLRTPADLELKDGYLIDFFDQQDGGGRGLKC